MQDCGWANIIQGSKERIRSLLLGSTEHLSLPIDHVNQANLHPDTFNPGYIDSGSEHYLFLCCSYINMPVVHEQ